MELTKKEKQYCSFKTCEIMEQKFADMIKHRWNYVTTCVISPNSPFPYYDVVAIDIYGNIDTFEVKGNKEENFLHMRCTDNGRATSMVMTKAKYWVQQTEDNFRIFKTDRLKSILNNNSYKLKDKNGKTYWDIGDSKFKEFIVDEFPHGMKPTDILKNFGQIVKEN